MKFFEVLTSLSLLFSLSLAAEFQVKLAEHNAQLEVVKQQINDMKIPIELFGADLNNLEDSGNANAIFDGILALTRAAIVSQGYDNVELPEGNLGFNMSFWPFGRIYGGVKLYDGFLRGMQNINRVGDATATNEGLTMLLESTVGIVNASMGYSLSITFLDIGPRGSMSGDMQYAHLYFKIRSNIITKVLVLDELSIEEIGPIKTRVTGLTRLFNWLAEDIADLAINLFKGFFASLIEGPIKKIINDIISGMIP